MTDQFLTISAAISPAADRAGTIAPHSVPAHPPFRSVAGARCWAELLIARREAARTFLAAQGSTPFLLNREHQPPNHWHVPGYGGGFLEHDLIALAEQLGMDAEAAHG